MISSDKLITSQLAAQMIMPRLSSDDYFSDNDYKLKIQDLVTRGIGGFCIFQGKVNETKAMTAELQSMAEIPLLFSADFENGLLMRLDNGSAFPHMMALGNLDEYEITYQIAKAIAKESKYLGIHWVFGPVADINSNPDNPIINIRSFGNNPALVKRQVEAYIKGMQEERVMACAKHFPGHGDTDQDSHIELPSIKKSLSDIMNFELEPFKTAINADVKSIMSAHLSVPALDDSNLPASLSEKINSVIRDKLKYDGIVVTDALDMNAIKDNFSEDEYLKLAVEAGIDILLLPENPGKALKILEREAVRDGNFKKKMIKSVNKILKMKQWCGLTTSVPDINESGVTKTFEEHEKIALTAAFRSMHFSGDKSLLPLPEGKDIAAFSYVQDEDLSGGTYFFRLLAQATENNIDFGFIDKDISFEQIDNMRNNLKETHITIIAFFVRSKAYSGSVNVSSGINEIVKRISGGNEVISIIFGNPYIKSSFDSNLYIDMFSDSLSSIAASVMGLTGRNLDYYN